MSEASVLQTFRSKTPVATPGTPSVGPYRQPTNDNATLCQSMDLIMVKGSTTVPPSSPPVVKVFNTVDRREVATLQLRGGELDPSRASSTQESTELVTTISCFAWSPNGQSVAVVTNPSHGSKWSFVSLFHILSANGTEPLEPYHVFGVNGTVQNAQWEMAGKDPPWTQYYSEEEEEHEMAWRTQLRYADQCSKFLPRSGYVNAQGGITTMESSSMAMEHDDAPASIPPDEDISTITPKAQNAMTILSLTTKDEQNHTTRCELYLHGRLRLGSLDFNKCNAITKAEHDASMCHPLVAASHDMTFWVAAVSPGRGLDQNSVTLSITHMPWIKEKQPQLQQVSASLASIHENVRILVQSVVADDWKTSLKRLDQIIQMMVDELKKYGITAKTGKAVEQQRSTSENVLDLADVIKEYIATGATADGKSDDEYSNVANAMDTFFTKGQMHDRLMERLDESLQTALANVETTVEKFLIRPSMALRVQAVELTRLSLREQNLMDELDVASDDLLSSVMLLQKRVVHSRSTIREFCEWLRSARALVQSKGTSANPNLKKRRVNPRVLSGLVAVLSDKDTNTAPLNESSNQLQVGLTESLLNLRVTELLKGDATSLNQPGLTVSTAKVQPSLNRIQDILNNGLAHRPILDESSKIVSQELAFSAADPYNIAVHTRIGCDIAEEDRGMWMEEDDSGETECFIPNMVVDSNDGSLLGDLSSCRQWGLVASWKGELIQLFCLPLGWRGTGDFDNDKIPFYLTAKMALPQGHSILSLGFYGDDGKCSLASGKDGGTGKEGAQELSILCQIQESSSPELYFLSYDSLDWQASVDDKLCFGSHVVDECCYRIVPAQPDDDEEESAAVGNTVCAQIMSLPETMSADEYFLGFSATRETVLVTSIRSGESVITHSVLEKKDDAGDEEEEEEEEEY